MRALALLVVAGALGGCGPLVGTDEGGEGTSDSGAGSSDGGPSTTVPGTSVGTTVGTSVGSSTDTGDTTSTSQDTSSGSADSVTFIDPSTTGCFAHCSGECDLWAQDCPEGEKCSAWANDGGNSWNATKCSPLDPNPQQAGETCTVEGSGVSGIDNCDIGSMCFWVDPETNMGECVPLCIGNQAAPDCVNECDRCMITNEGVLILCMTECDPLAQDCGNGRGCYPSVNGDGFLCMPPASAPALVGEPCDWHTACVPGSFCAPPEAVPGCVDAAGCCARFCNVDAQDPCPAAPPEVQCVSWWQGEPAPASCGSWASVGACVVPS